MLLVWVLTLPFIPLRTPRNAPLSINLIISGSYNFAKLQTAI